MELSREIHSKLYCDDQSDLSGIIVKITVQSGTKNPYIIYFPKTVANGESLLSLNDFEGQFKDHWESGLMDYNGNIEDALPTAVVQLFDPVAMQKSLSSIEAFPLLKHEKQKWGSRTEMIEYFLS